MEKVLFLIMSGEKDKEKANLGLNISARSHQNHRYEDVKVLLYGESEDYVTKIKDEKAAEAFKYLTDNKLIDSACIYIAKMYNIEDSLKNLSVSLEPAG